MAHENSKYSLSIYKWLALTVSGGSKEKHGLVSAGLCWTEQLLPLPWSCQLWASHQSVKLDLEFKVKN
jgi:hypothetical protein